MGVEIRVEGLTKSFGKQVIWEDVSLTLPAGEISVLLGPSGTGKSVFLKHLVGLLRPDRGHVYVDGADVPRLSEHHLYETRKKFGVLFQDGALFGSMSIYDNVAFPLREHTRKGESEIKKIVTEKLEMVGLTGAEKKLPGEISGGMRKRAGLARALVLDPQVILFDEPDSGLDPVRTAYLCQLIVDLNAQIEATMLIVTHDINTARTVPDNIGLLYRRHLAMFGPREMLLSSQEPVVRQFLNARREGPIGMAEEKDSAELAAEKEAGGDELPPLPPIPPQITPSDGEQRRTMRPPGQWLKENGVTPPPGSYAGEGSDWDGGGSTAPPASSADPGQEAYGQSTVTNVRTLQDRRRGGRAARGGGDGPSRAAGDGPARRGGDGSARGAGDGSARRGGDGSARRGDDGSARRGDNGAARGDGADPSRNGRRQAAQPRPTGEDSKTAMANGTRTGRPQRRSAPPVVRGLEAGRGQLAGRMQRRAEPEGPAEGS